MRPTRRQIGAGGIGLLSGGAILSTQTETTEAVSLSGEVSIPDKQKSVVSAVDGVNMEITGSFGWESDTLPTDAVLRVEVSRSGSFEQLEAKRYDTDLTRDYTQDYSLTSINLLDHSRLSITDLSPTENGETKTVDLQTRLVLEVNNNGETLESTTSKDSHTISVTKTQGETTLSMEGTGEITISTSEE